MTADTGTPSFFSCINCNISMSDRTMGDGTIADLTADTTCIILCNNINCVDNDICNGGVGYQSEKASVGS